MKSTNLIQSVVTSAATIVILCLSAGCQHFDKLYRKEVTVTPPQPVATNVTFVNKYFVATPTATNEYASIDQAKDAALELDAHGVTNVTRGEIRIPKYTVIY